LVQYYLVDEGKDKISIWNFFIHEEHRNKKYGYKAIQEVIKLYPNKTFWLYVVKENIIAFNLYKKLGFTIEKEYSYKYDMILKN
jgi:ribosomal protein S18 acetylase RimI-like enzyme